MADNTNPTKPIPGTGGNPLNHAPSATFELDKDRGDTKVLDPKSPRERTGNFDKSNRDPYMKTAVSGAYPRDQIAKARGNADAIAKDHDEEDMDI